MNDIGHFPMSENHDLFRGYLLQALQIIERRRARARAPRTGRGGERKTGARTEQAPLPRPPQAERRGESRTRSWWTRSRTS
jgi:hypothetical protein